MLERSGSLKKEVTVGQVQRIRITKWVDLKVGHFLQLRTGLLLQSVALMFTIQVGGLDVDEASKLGGQLDLRMTISSRKASSRSQDVQGLELG